MAQQRKGHARTRIERGYDAAYDRARARWKLQVDAGKVSCWRCRRWINPAFEWHLGHDDSDRRIIRGPEHPKCNLRAAAHKTNAIRRAKSQRRAALKPVRSRAW